MFQAAGIKYPQDVGNQGPIFQPLFISILVTSHKTGFVGRVGPNSERSVFGITIKTLCSESPVSVHLKSSVEKISLVQARSDTRLDSERKVLVPCHQAI